MEVREGFEPSHSGFADRRVASSPPHQLPAYSIVLATSPRDLISRILIQIGSFYQTNKALQINILRTKNMFVIVGITSGFGLRPKRGQTGKTSKHVFGVFCMRENVSLSRKPQLSISAFSTAAAFSGPWSIEKCN